MYSPWYSLGFSLSFHFKSDFSPYLQRKFLTDLSFLQVEPRTTMPVVAIVIVTLVSCLPALIRIGSATVYNDIISLSVSGFYASYFIPCAFLLWRRSTGQMIEHSELTGANLNKPLAVKDHRSNDDDGREDNYVVHPRLVWGPWRIRGIWGTINNAFACAYMIFVIFWSFWPPATPVKPETMNYSVLMTGSVIIFSLVYYRVWGRTQYLGPLVDQELVNSISLVNSPSGHAQALSTDGPNMSSRTDRLAVMAWLVVGRLRGDAKAPRDKKQPKYLRDAIKPVYFFTSTLKDYCFRTRLSLMFFFFRLMKGVTWPYKNIREKIGYERGNLRGDAKISR